jgi:hypothetical protein
MCYDETVLRGAVTNGLFNGNRLFTSLAAVLEHITTMLFHSGSNAFDNLRFGEAPKFRNLEQLQAAGYKLKRKVGDPFTYAEIETTRDALAR